MAEQPLEFFQKRSRQIIDAVETDFAHDATVSPVPVKSAPSLLCDCVAVWAKSINNGSQQVTVFVGVPFDFPDEPPIACIADGKQFLLKTPHIDERGFICTIPDSAAIDSSNPTGLVRYVFENAERILAGTGAAEFQSEFAAYWNRSLTSESKPVLLLNSPEELKGDCAAFFGKDATSVATSITQINHWFSNITSQKSKIEKVNGAVTLWLKEPLVPSLYPDTIKELVLLAEKNDLQSAQRLKKHIINGQGNGVAVLIQKEGEGVALGGVIFPTFGITHQSPLSIPGFRPGKAPVDVVFRRMAGSFEKSRVQRTSVQRVDHQWIHSRGGDGRDLSKKSVLLIGCGSLGGYVAHLLSRAGVGHLTITDNDKLSWENIGRHILGAHFVGQSKAEALATELKRQLPHLSFKAYPKDWRIVYQLHPDIFSTHDLIISTTGDWRCERPLNELTRKIEMPPVALAWLEPHAVAGHCLVIGSKGGCFECDANRFGRFNSTVAVFKAQTTLSREPGGCTHYQHYGPTALMPIASMIATVAIDSILAPIEGSFLNTWISSAEHFNSIGAELTPAWSANPTSSTYSKSISKEWPKSNSCTLCSGTKP